MTNVKDVGKLFDLAMSLDTVREPVKVDMKVPGYLTLVLAMTVEQTFSNNDPGNYLRKIVSEEDQAKLMQVVADILKKAGLEQFYLQLKQLTQP